MMRARKIKRICGVRGCRNTDCYVIARFCEFANSVIICKSCLKDALTAIDPSIFEVKAETVKEPTAESNTEAAAKPKRQTARRTSKTKEE